MSQERYDAFFRFVEEFSPTAQKPETVPLEMIQYYRDSMKGILEKVPTLSTEMLVVTEIGELMKLMTEMGSMGIINPSQQRNSEIKVNQNIRDKIDQLLFKSMYGRGISRNEQPILAVTILAIGQAYSGKIRQVLAQGAEKSAADFMLHWIQNDYLALMVGRSEIKLPQSYFQQQHRFPTYPR